MIAAARVELRALFGSVVMRMVLLVAMLLPFIQWLLSVATSHGEPSSWHAVSYDEAFDVALAATGIATVLTAAWIGANGHRQGVFGSYVVTGHPRDLLFVGRLLTSWIVAVLLTLGSVAVALAVHGATAAKAFTISAPDVVGQTSPVRALQVAGDVSAVLLVSALAATFMVGLSTLLRSSIGTLGVFAGLLFADAGATDAARAHWLEETAVVPIERLYDVPLTFEPPWWSVTSALESMLETADGRGIVHGGLGWDGVLLIAGWGLLACTAAMYRLLRRDA